MPSCAKPTRCCGSGPARTRGVEGRPSVVGAGGGVALRHATQEVRHTLVRHAEEMGDARDTLTLGAERHDEGAPEVPTRLRLTPQDGAHQLHRARLVLVSENALPFAAVVTRLAHLGDPLGEQPLALGVLL